MSDDTEAMGIQASEIKRIDIKEFREVGFLQEANRQFFHPLGLALEVVQDDCPTCGGHGRRAPAYKGEVRDPCSTCGGSGVAERLGGVWDYREDPEGVLFAPGMIDLDKVTRVKAERDSHVLSRIAQVKAVVQRPPQE